MITQVTQSVVSLNSVKQPEKNAPANAPGSVEQVQKKPVQETAVQPGLKRGNNESVQREANEIVQDLNEFAQKIQRKLQFSIDTDSGSTVIKVLNRDTDELVRQIPAESILSLREHLGSLQQDLYDGKLPGLLFKAEV